jgi:hypothetical protein
MNDESQPLQLHELEVKKKLFKQKLKNKIYSKIKFTKHMKQNQDIRNRLLKSFEMMLDFYGMKISDRNLGKIERADNHHKRYSNLKMYLNFIIIS